jgi:hypothetical protein
MATLMKRSATAVRNRAARLSIVVAKSRIMPCRNEHRFTTQPLKDTTEGIARD